MNDRELLRAIEKAAREKTEDLDLSIQNLTTLPAEIGTLVNLKSLDLSRNHIAALPLELWKLTKLTMLNLANNDLTALPPEIGKLTNLIKLYLFDNELTSLPPEIGNLICLNLLSLDGNKLTTLPPEIGKLGGLTTLYLYNNGLTALPPEIGKLFNLTELYVWVNQLNALPPEIGKLTNLKVLYLHGNSLTALPPEIGKLTNLADLDIRSNPLPIPPEILEAEGAPARIINYYFEHLAGDKRPLNEAKMLIVGQGGVGKTSLVKRLIDDEYDPHEKKTEGIDIRDWRIDCGGTEMRLNVWDFGGQEIMHATHQFFLTKRSLYVLVLVARQGDQESRIEYWLKIIQSFGGDSPIIVVSNKSDQHELDLDWTGLQRKYPAIKGFVRRVSCESGEGIQELREIIQREVDGLEHIHDELLVTWFAVKSQLEGMADNYIPYEKYQEMCREQGVGDEVSMRTLVGFLHDLGLVLHFGDHPILGDLNILNPEWVTKGVYQIINSSILAQNKGVLSARDLPSILKPTKDYPKRRHPFITEMMRKFELCFDFPDQPNEQFLVPDLLPKEEADTGDWEDSLAFQYHYDVLPGSIISRFIVRMNGFISKGTYWRNGVVLEYEEGRNKALVRADIEDRKLFIHVSGSPATRRTFLGVIRADLKRIHDSVRGLAVDQKVPLPEDPNIVVDYDHLLTLEELGKDAFVPEGLKVEVSVKQLLDGVVSPEERQDARREGRGERRIETHYHAEKMYFGDQYSAEQVAAMGSNARADNISFTQSWNEIRDDVDLQGLAAQLAELQGQLKSLASKGEHYDAIGDVARAENAARENDGPSVLRHLASAGKWVLGQGIKVGADLAVAYGKAQIGMGA